MSVLKDLSSLSLLEYNSHISHLRPKEYPSLFQKDNPEALYLDHAGTTPPSSTLLTSFHQDMLANLYGNPHSTSPSSLRTTNLIESVRLQALNFLGADLEIFDLVFTANATAAIKLVMEAMREQEAGFWFGYHVDSHTSVVGVREAAREHQCFESDGEVEMWLDCSGSSENVGLFAYPAQSNLNGRRSPLSWPARIPTGGEKRVYTLLDAAAYASTSPLKLCEFETAPDFTVLSFTKIFGFPDLGALVVRKDAGHIFQHRKYFGGGTVDTVVCVKEQWHAVKTGPLHERLEDGTLPFHSILALKSAFSSHEELFGSLDLVAAHTSALALDLYERLDGLRHMNGKPVCKIYKDSRSMYGDLQTQGPIIAFNLKDSQGKWISNHEVEKLATIKDIHLRTGGLCNPGGVAQNLELAPWQFRENFSAGWRCGGENDVMNGKPTGVIRVSFGAMSAASDAIRFAEFVEEFFVDKSCSAASSALPSPVLVQDASTSGFYVESLAVYPIKSCAGWQVPNDMPWDVRREGLVWDREWCIVKTGTGAALSQKAHPRMALIRPALDFSTGTLRVKVVGSEEELTVPLSKDPRYHTETYKPYDATVCGEKIRAKVYTSPTIAEFFTRAVGVPCTLARFPASAFKETDIRHSKRHISPSVKGTPRPILLSNESPILTISRSSLNRLNETIKASGGKAVPLAAFRANIVLAESPFLPPGHERPWEEDGWEGMQTSSSGTQFVFMGGCRRCQMVCVDQESGEKRQEPFVSLAKTRRFPGGRVLFGVHTSLVGGGEGGSVRVGEGVKIWRGDHVWMNV